MCKYFCTNVKHVYRLSDRFGLKVFLPNKNHLTGTKFENGRSLLKKSYFPSISIFFHPNLKPNPGRISVYSRKRDCPGYLQMQKAYMNSIRVKRNQLRSNRNYDYTFIYGVKYFAYTTMHICLFAFRICVELISVFLPGKIRMFYKILKNSQAK